MYDGIREGELWRNWIVAKTEGAKIFARENVFYDIALAINVGRSQFRASARRKRVSIVGMRSPFSTRATIA
jgi:hypothetical protein